MEIEITGHARDRMQTYNVSEEILKNSINYPDSIAEGYGNRRIYQKKLNGYTLRIIIEEEASKVRVITVYKAKSGRYEI